MKVDDNGVPLLIQKVNLLSANIIEVLLFNNVSLKVYTGGNIPSIEEYILEHYKYICALTERDLLNKYSNDKTMVDDIIKRTEFDIDRFYFGKLEQCGY